MSPDGRLSWWNASPSFPSATMWMDLHGQRGARGEAQHGQRAGPLGTGSAGTARPGWAPAPVPGRTARAGDRQWQDGGAYVHDLSSKGRAATRGEAAAYGLAGPPGGESTRNPLIPGRVPLARLHRGGADRAGPGRASQRASRTPGRASGRGASCCHSETAREHRRARGRRAAPSGRSCPQSPLRRAASAGSCRLPLLPLLLL